MPTNRRTIHPYLDDPIAFAHELYSLLAAGGDGRLVGGEVAAYKPFNAAIGALQTVLEDGPPGADRLLSEVDELAISLASDEHGRGVEFGVAAEQLRRTMLDGASGPRIPWAPATDQPAAAMPAPVKMAAIRNVHGTLQLTLGGQRCEAPISITEYNNGAWAVAVRPDGEGSCDQLVYMRAGISAHEAMSVLVDAIGLHPTPSSAAAD